MTFPQPSDFDPVGIPDSHIYDNPNNNKKYIWNGSNWSVYYPPGSISSEQQFAVSTVNTTEPVDSSDGDFWYDTTDDNLQVRYNDEWISAAMNKEQSQTLDDLKDSLYYPKYILEEDDASLPNFMLKRGWDYSLSRYSSSGFYPLDSNGSRYSNSSGTTICYGMEFYSFNQYDWDPDPALFNDQLKSFNDNLSKELITGYFEYKRSNRRDFTYRPTVRSVTRSGSALYVKFNGSTHIGDTDSLYNVLFTTKRSNSYEVLKHESRIITRTTDINLRFYNDRPHNENTVIKPHELYFYKLDSNDKVAYYSSSVDTLFVPAGNFSDISYYWNDELKRTITRSLSRPEAPFKVNNEYIIPASNITWTTITINNQQVEGLRFQTADNRKMSTYSISFTINCKLTYTGAVDSADSVAYDYEDDADILVDFGS